MSEEKELLNEPWTYESKESGEGYEKRLSHIIKYKGKMISRTRGTQELEGSRCKKIVQKCNTQNIVPDSTVCCADFGGTAESRIAKINKLAEQRDVKFNAWMNKHSVSRETVKGFTVLKAVTWDRETKKHNNHEVSSNNIHEAARLLAEKMGVIDWEGYKNELI